MLGGSLFAATDRLQRHVDSGELEEADGFCVLARIDVGFGQFVQVWRRVLTEEAERYDDDEDDDEFEIWGPAPTPHGAAFELAKFLAPAVCLQRFVDMLSRTGFDGVVDRFDAQEPQPCDDLMVCRIDLDGEAYVRLKDRNYPLPAGAPHDQVRGLPRWALPDSHRSQILDFIDAWCCRDAAATVYLSVEHISFPLAADEIAALLRDAVEWRDGFAPIRIFARTPTRFRRVEFDPDGGVLTLTVGGWPMTEARRARALAELKRVLLATAGWSVYGRIRRVVQPPYPSGRNDLAQGCWPEPPSNPIPAWLDLRLITERGAVPDAFGVQLLNPSVAATVLPRHPEWVSTPVATGHVLLEHRNLEAWYANARPDPVVLDQARADLATLIRPTGGEHGRTR